MNTTGQTNQCLPTAITVTIGITFVSNAGDVDIFVNHKINSLVTIIIHG